MRGKPGTKEEQRRKDACRELGCIACRLDGKPDDECWIGTVDIHHMTDGRAKLGEWATVPLCPPHHVGNNMSWHRTRRRFRERYGNDLELIAKVNAMLEERKC